MAVKEATSIIVVLVFIVVFSGCATIMQGTTQSVGIASTPTGATVIVDNVEKGRTPIVVDLKRKDHHFVKIEMPGYMPYETAFTRSTSGWVWGNIVFGGLIGLAIDAMAGGLYKLTPTEVNAVLAREGVSSLYRQNSLYIAVVLTPDPKWEKIGQLEKL